MIAIASGSPERVPEKLGAGPVHRSELTLGATRRLAGARRLMSSPDRLDVGAGVGRLSRERSVVVAHRFATSRPALQAASDIGRAGGESGCADDGADQRESAQGANHGGQAEAGEKAAKGEIGAKESLRSSRFEMGRREEFEAQAINRREIEALRPLRVLRPGLALREAIALRRGSVFAMSRLERHRPPCRSSNGLGELGRNRGASSSARHFDAARPWGRAR